MTKQQLSDAVASKLGIKQEVMRDITNELIETIIDELVCGGGLYIRGFGSLTVKERKAKVGFIPHKHERVEIPSVRTPVFKVSKEFKDKVN